MIGAGDPTLQGFPTDISVNRGGTVHFKIRTDAATYQIDIYRMGYYGGMGARKVATITPSAVLPQTQPACATNGATGLVDCGNWTESAAWAVPATAASGIYFAKLKRPDTGGASHIVFIVRDDAGHANVLFQTSDTTWQAYNRYGGNSLYDGGPGTNPGRAYKVSYNRPLTTRGTTPENAVFNAEYPMVRWLEANGFDVSYISGVDTDRFGAALITPQLHKIYMSVGHDEYWSGAQRANVEAARAAGVHLAFFGANNIFWKTRWEPSIDGTGTPYRTLVSYKETHANAAIDPMDPGTWTGTWRDPRFSPPADGGRPENALLGTIFTVECCQSQFPSIAIPPTAAALRFWRNTPIAANAGGALVPSISGPDVTAGGMLGFEWDEDVDNGFRPAGLIQLAATTATVDEKLQNYGSTYAAGTATHATTLYRHQSGALVFSAGTVQWSWGLDNTHDRLPEAISDYTNLSAMQATVNLLADMGAQPVTLQSGLTTAAQSSDTVAPTSAITSPSSGASFGTGSNVTITGTAADVAGRIAVVDVSVDGGASWHRATGQANWTFAWQPTGNGSVTIKSRAIDDSGNIESPGAQVTVSVLNQQCPCTIWNQSATPAISDVADGNQVELGVKFRADLSGYITGVRFYKSLANTGTHIGNLWTTSGTLLATATFSGESGSGWQQVTFPSPVAVTANTTYVASYHTEVGHYSANGGYFVSAGLDTPPLHAVGNGTSANGVYLYGDTSFPTSSFNGTNYWVDVVFNTTLPADTTPPTVTATAPAAGATGVSAAAPVTATFSEALAAASVTTATFELRDAANALVAAAVGYDGPTRTAALTPGAALAAGATYTARLHGGASGARVTDVAGNALAADLTWSFTTAAPGTCPCSIWNPATTVPSLPDAGDASALELGVKFRADSAGFITGVKFYKSAANTGTHTGSLWTTAGTQLATATFSAESGSGWQTVTFASPVAVAANTTYVASYHTNAGHYAAGGGFFASAVDAPPLHAVANGTSANGVYQYGASGYPSSSYNATNYWVDVVFTTTGAADTTPPTVTATAPAAGATGVSAAVPVTATFSEALAAASVTTATFELRDAANALVAAAVGYDGPTRTATLTPGAALGTGATYTARLHGGASGARVTDAAGNALAADVTWSFTTAAPGTCPCSIWTPASVPSLADAGDAASVELGVKFRADSAGFITGVKFYKSAANTGTHTGSLWTTAGTLLATATFSAESGSGWQTMTFGSPVAVAANTIYVASYHTNTGHYAAGGGYFASAGVDTPPLHAVANGTSANGVYQYGASGYPSSSYNATNYWVDVVFTTTGAADTTAPTVTATAPAAGATGVGAAAPVTATFSEALAAASVTTATFELRDAANALVAAAVGYDGPTRTATLTPGAALAAAATYTARLHGGASGARVTDVAGNALAADVTWSFTIAALPSAYVETTAADFARGSFDIGAYVGQTGDGEVMLAPVAGSEFSGSALPAGWSLASWGGAATGTVASGFLSVDGGRASTDQVYGAGRSLEFSAIFSGASYQHVGLGLTLSETPWAIFSSRGGDALYARTNNGAQTIETPIAGSWFGAAHRFRIDWTVSGLIYSIDGVTVATHALPIGESMRPIVSDYGSDANPVRVDWLRLTPYASLQEGPGLASFTSGVVDAAAVVTWTGATWNGATPAGTSVVLSVRYGNTPTPDASWTLFTNVSGPINAVGRYLQYRLILSSTDPNQSPVVTDVTLNVSR